MTSLKYIFIISIISLTLFSCQNRKSKEIETILRKMQGQQIYFPNTLRPISIENDTLCSTIFEKENRIVVYIDSAGCTSCKMRLRDWNNIIKYSLDTVPNLSVIFVISPPKGKAHKIISLIDKYNINYPFFIDSLNQFEELNKLPKELQFHTFLINKKDQIVLVGSPVDNIKIWQLYKDYATKHIKNSEAIEVNKNELNPKLNDLTQVELLRDSINLGKFSSQTTKLATFQLKNNGEKPLVINAVNTSCGCTVATFDKIPAPPGKSSTIVLEYKPNTLGYFSKTADVVCNVPNGIVRLTISGEVLEK